MESGAPREAQTATPGGKEGHHQPLPGTRALVGASHSQDQGHPGSWMGSEQAGIYKDCSRQEMKAEGTQKVL